MSVSISKAMIDNPKARSKNQRGALNPFYGKEHTVEAKLKMKEKSWKCKGNTHPALGKTWKNKESTKKKLSETCTGRFRVYKEDGTWTWGYPKT